MQEERGRRRLQAATLAKKQALLGWTVAARLPQLRTSCSSMLRLFLAG